MFFVYDSIWLFHVKIIGLSSLESLLPIWISSLAHFYPPLNPTFLSPPLCSRVCCLSMPRQRESLDSVKARLVREQKGRTDRRVRELLQPIQTIEDSDDSEEENRLIQRKRRENKDQATQTDSSSLSFCCGVLVGVFVVVILLFCLIGLIGNDRQRMAR